MHAWSGERVSVIYMIFLENRTQQIFARGHQVPKFCVQILKSLDFFVDFTMDFTKIS